MLSFSKSGTGSPTASVSPRKLVRNAEDLVHSSNIETERVGSANRVEQAP